MSVKERLKKYAVYIVILCAAIAYKLYTIATDDGVVFDGTQIVYLGFYISALVVLLRIVFSEDAYEEQQRESEKRNRIFKRIYGRYYRLGWWPMIVLGLADRLLLRFLPYKLFWISWIPFGAVVVLCLVYGFFHIIDEG